MSDSLEQTSTRKRLDGHSTEFGLWLRDQPQIASGIGYVTSNLDFMWRNYKTKKYMLIEEKRFGKSIVFPQSELFEIMHKNLQHDPLYCGFFFLQFSKTSPDDGDIFIKEFFLPKAKKVQVTKDELLAFLQFTPLDDIIKSRTLQRPAVNSVGMNHTTNMGYHDMMPAW